MSSSNNFEQRGLIQNINRAIMEMDGNGWTWMEMDGNGWIFQCIIWVVGQCCTTKIRIVSIC